jgi:cytochrome c-type biogenesis protein CcmH/NrfG
MIRSRMKSKFFNAILLCLLFHLCGAAQQTNSTPAMTAAEEGKGGGYDWPAGETAFRQMVENQPKDSAAWSNLGKCLYGLNKFSEAAHCFERAISLGRTNSDTYLWEGYSYCMLND